MNKDSIIFSITITFFIALFLVLLSFAILYKVSEQKEEASCQKRDKQATRMCLRAFENYDTKNLKENLELINYSIISPEMQQKILKNPNLQFQKLHKKHRHFMQMQELELDGKHYVYIQSRRGEALLLNNNEKHSHSHLIFILFVFVLFAFLLFYLTTLKKLKPLKSLKQKVENLGDEEFDISCSSDKKDEISLLANEFDKSARKLKKLRDSRNVFIRNIMHELKTPITKGKFLTELASTKENNIKMQKVFYRLESLINEFASIEELISTKKRLQMRDYYLVDIIDNAVDILMCDENSIVQEFENTNIKVDFKLFSIAIKNLIDNAIKYSPDKKITIKTEGSKIIFQNKGKALNYELERYYEPFFSPDIKKSNQGFGLGLYIVQNILSASGYKLEYEYKNQLNIFSVYLES